MTDLEYDLFGSGGGNGIDGGHDDYLFNHHGGARGKVRREEAVEEEGRREGNDGLVVDGGVGSVS